MLNIIIFVIVILLALWLGVISFYFWRLKRNYALFVKGNTRKTLEEALSNILKEQRAAKNDIAELVTRCARIESDAKTHIQKVGLMRFNPFKDTGGDQSFILALADANNSGVVITGLHSRSGIRWFLKRVKEGRGVDVELSEEEKKALRGDNS